MALKDIISSRDIALYVSNLPTIATVDESLFPRVKQIGMEIEMAKGSRQKPVVLRMSTFDTNVKVRALSASLSIAKKEMPFFKESVLINEKDRQMLLLALSSNNQNLVEQIASQIYENYLVLVDGADVQAKRMRAQLIQNGLINMVTADGDVVVDYNAPATHKATLSVATAKWSDTTNSDPYTNLFTWQDTMVQEGYAKPTRMICTAKVFGYIRQNQKIIKHIQGLDTNKIVTDSLIKQFLLDMLDITVEIVNGTYIDEAGSTQSFYTDTQITLLPPTGAIGRTVYGTTPEEADKQYGAGTLDTEIVRTGIAITTMPKSDPVTVETKVSMLMLPSFDRIDECFFATIN